MPKTENFDIILNKDRGYINITYRRKPDRWVIGQRKVSDNHARDLSFYLHLARTWQIMIDTGVRFWIVVTQPPPGTEVIPILCLTRPVLYKPKDGVFRIIEVNADD